MRPNCLSSPTAFPLGGRAECRIRNWEVPVCPLDFMSQYATVNELLDNWGVLTAKCVTFPDATKEVRRLLSQITLKRCFDRKLWQRFRFFALVRPNNDILPVRTVYNGTTQNIALAASPTGLKLLASLRGPFPTF